MPSKNSVNMSIKVSREQRDAIKRLADDLGLSVNATIRYALQMLDRSLSDSDSGRAHVRYEPMTTRQLRDIEQDSKSIIGMLKRIELRLSESSRSDTKGSVRMSGLDILSREMEDVRTAALALGHLAEKLSGGGTEFIDIGVSKTNDNGDGSMSKGVSFCVTPALYDEIGETAGTLKTSMANTMRLAYACLRDTDIFTATFDAPAPLRHDMCVVMRRELAFASVELRRLVILFQRAEADYAKIVEDVYQGRNPAREISESHRLFQLAYRQARTLRPLIHEFENCSFFMLADDRESQRFADAVAEYDEFRRREDPYADDE